MAFHNSGRIVTSGLVLSLDAADRNSYVSGSTTWFDLSGNNNSGSLINGPAYTGSNGGAIVFDGSNDYVNVGDPTSLRLGTGNFTINSFVKTLNVDIDGQIIIKRQSISPYTSINLSLGSWFDTGGGGITPLASKRVRIAIRQDGSNQYIATTTNDVTDGNWKYISLVRNSGTIALYVNAVTQPMTVIYNTGTGISSDVSANGYTYSIGAIGDVGISYLTGSISQVQIYNRALSAQEVRQNYDAMKSRFNLT